MSRNIHLLISLKNKIDLKLNSVNLSKSKKSSEEYDLIADNLLNTIENLNLEDDDVSFEDEEILESVDILCDDDYELVIEPFEISNNFFSLEFMEKVVNYRDQHPTHNFSRTIQKKWPSLKSDNYISRFRDYIKNLGTNREKFYLVSKFTYEKFLEARR